MLGIRQQNKQGGDAYVLTKRQADKPNNSPKKTSQMQAKNKQNAINQEELMINQVTIRPP